MDATENRNSAVSRNRRLASSRSSHHIINMPTHGNSQKMRFGPTMARSVALVTSDAFTSGMPEAYLLP